MKRLTLILLFNLLFAFSLLAQSVIYKANSWGNAKEHESWAVALDYPIHENVVIVQTDKLIKITFGGKRTLIYTIVKFEKLGSATIKYTVKMDNKIYLIEKMFIENEYYFHCKNEWAVANITDVSTSSNLIISTKNVSQIDTLGKPQFFANAYSCDNPRSSGYENIKFVFGSKNIYIIDKRGFQFYKILNISKNEWGSSIYSTESQKGNPYEIRVMKGSFGDTAIQTTSVNGIIINYFKEYIKSSEKKIISDIVEPPVKKPEVDSQHIIKVKLYDLFTTNKALYDRMYQKVIDTLSIGLLKFTPIENIESAYYGGDDFQQYIDVNLTITFLAYKCYIDVINGELKERDSNKINNILVRLRSPSTSLNNSNVKTYAIFKDIQIKLETGKCMASILKDKIEVDCSHSGDFIIRERLKDYPVGRYYIFFRIGHINEKIVEDIIIRKY